MTKWARKMHQENCFQGVTSKLWVKYFWSLALLGLNEQMAGFASLWVCG